MKKFISGQVITNLVNAIREQNSIVKYNLWVAQEFGNLIKTKSDKISFFNGYYSALKSIVEGFDLVGKTIHCFPNFNYDIVAFLSEYGDFKFYDIKNIFEIKEPAINQGDVIILGSYFSNPLRFSEEFIVKAKEKKCFIIQVIDGYDFMNDKIFTFADVVLLSFNKLSLFTVDNVVIALQNNEEIDLFVLANGGFTRDGKRIYDYPIFASHPLHLAVFRAYFGLINDYFLFQNTANRIVERDLKIKHKIIGSTLVVKPKQKKEFKHLVCNNYFSQFKDVNFPAGFMKTFRNLCFLDIHFSLPFKRLEEAIKELNEGGEYEDI